MPKALAPLAGRTVLHWSVAAAAGAPSVTKIVVAAPAGHIERALEIARDAAGPSMTLRAVEGGAERADSVAVGLEDASAAIVAVHDAARPLVSSEAFETLVAIVASGEVDGAILATPVFDTLKRARGGDPQLGPRIEETVDRRGLWAAQTPQVFVTEILRNAYEAAGQRAGEATDEAMLVERSGGTVRLVPASGPNFKVTSADDLAIAETLLTAAGDR